MHGGAVGCAVEQASLLARARNTDATGQLVGPPGHYDTDCYVQGVEVRYICAMKGELQITCSEDPYAPLLEADSHGKRWSSKTFGKVSS